MKSIKEFISSPNNVHIPDINSLGDKYPFLFIFIRLKSLWPINPGR